MTNAAQTAPIRRALLSVSDKTGLIELGTALARQGVELLSTGAAPRPCVMRVWMYGTWPM